jgi:hypothetical protein
MAPSRALFCRISARTTSAARHTPSYLRPTSRLLSTSVVRQPCSSRLPVLHSHSVLPIIRAYSAQAADAPQPPDYLNEAELHIFNKIKGELEPVKLEVRWHFTWANGRWRRFYMFHKQGSGDARNTPMVIARSTTRKGHTDDCTSYLFAGKYATQHATPTIEPSYHTHTHASR